MKKAMLILLSAAAYTFSLNDVSVPNTFTPSTPARSSEVNANFDTLASRINQNNDTIEQKFIRFSDLESGDSILEKCRIDTARIDHIRSNPEADSMTITKADINGGTIDGTVIGANSAAAGTFTTVTASGAIAGSTINTGNGAYEIGQSNRTTDSPTFDGLTLNSDLTVGGSIISSKASGLVISTNSIDGADDRFVSLFAGGGNTNRSGGIVAYGNESSGHGDLRLYAGVGNGTVAGNIKFESTALVARAASFLFGDAENSGRAKIRFNDTLTFDANAHGIQDYNTIKLGNNKAYCSYDCRVKFEGTRLVDHYAGLQINPTVNSTVGMTNLYGTYSVMNVSQGEITNIYNHQVLNANGGATVTNQYGLYIDELTKATNNYAIYTAGATKSFIGGKLGIQTTTPTEALDVVGNIKSSGNVSAKKQMADSARIDDTLWVGTTNATKIYDGWYLEGSYLCTLSGFTSTVTCTTYYVKCGKAVTLTFSTAAGTSNTDYINISTGLMPASIRPAREMFWKLAGPFGGLADTVANPLFAYYENIFQMGRFQSSGSKAIYYSFSISYLTY